MLIYEKDGKLNLNFQTGNVPVKPNDVVISKETDKVKVMLGSTEVSAAKTPEPIEPEPSNPEEDNSSE